ncbi:leucyl aminopeptidase, partial [bacterium]|nr:leucyl aminopeptidase [bacterium]
LVGLGKKSKVSLESFRKAAGEAVRRVGKSSHITWILDRSFPDVPTEQVVQAIAEGLAMGAYRFDRYKKADPERKNHDIFVSIQVKGVTKKMENRAATGTVIGNAVNTARDFANMPPNELTPTAFAKRIKTELKGLPVEIELIDQKKAVHLGMGAFLGVSQGSVESPCMVVMRYKPVKGAPIGLVGKGVTFDSGGISIKPAKGMSDMKADMSGAAAVVAAIASLARLNVKVNVTGLVALTENMASGSAQRPGDIVKAMNGKSIEIINTDAEGRLILADCLALASEEKPDVLIDFSTLTGAARTAVGTEISALFSNDDRLAAGLTEAGMQIEDPIWRLPLHAAYNRMLDSRIADLNSAPNTPYAGAITAALFMQNFVGADIPWAHFDFMAWNLSSKPGRPEGGEAMALRAVFQYLENSIAA